MLGIFQGSVLQFGQLAVKLQNIHLRIMQNQEAGSAAPQDSDKIYDSCRLKFVVNSMLQLTQALFTSPQMYDECSESPEAISMKQQLKAVVQEYQLYHGEGATPEMCTPCRMGLATHLSYLPSSQIQKDLFEHKYMEKALLVIILDKWERIRKDFYRMKFGLETGCLNKIVKQ